MVSWLPDWGLELPEADSMLQAFDSGTGQDICSPCEGSDGPDSIGFIMLFSMPVIPLAFWGEIGDSGPPLEVVGEVMSEG